MGEAATDNGKGSSLSPELLHALSIPEFIESTGFVVGEQTASPPLWSSQKYETIEEGNDWLCSFVACQKPLQHRSNYVSCYDSCTSTLHRRVYLRFCSVRCCNCSSPATASVAAVLRAVRHSRVLICRWAVDTVRNRAGREDREDHRSGTRKYHVLRNAINQGANKAGSCTGATCIRIAAAVRATGHRR